MNLTRKGVANPAAPFAISEPTLKTAHVWKFVLVVYVLILALISAAAYTKHLHVAALVGSSHLDKVIHFFLLGGASFLARKASADARMKFLNLPVGPFIVGLCATIDECAQAFSPARTFDFADMFANLGGVVVFGWLAGLKVKKKDPLTSNPLT